MTANLYSEAVGINTRKASPTTLFGTRKLAFLVVVASGMGNSPEAQNSLFYRTVGAIQQRVEIYGIGDIAGDYVTIIVSDDTTAYGDGESYGDGGTNTVLQDALSDAGISATVWNAHLVGGGLNYD